MIETVVQVPRAQQRVWLADQLTPHRAVYLGGTFLRLRGRLDLAALRRALTEIVIRHQVLRTSIVERNGELVGLLRSPTEFQLEVQTVDPVGLDAAIRAAASTPLDVAGGLPLRARLLRLSIDDHVLGLIVHHLAYDGGSVRIMYRELAHYYTAFAERRRSPTVVAPLPPLTRQFRDIAAEGEAQYDAGELRSVLEQRRAALAGRSPFELPTDQPRPPVRSGEGTLNHAFDLPAETVRRLAELARERTATLYMVLLAACHTVLYRYSGRSDVITGTSSSTRHDPGSGAVIGPFFNMVVIPGDVSGNPTFRELIDRVRDAALDAYEARLLPFDTLVTELRVERDPAITPLFQILVDLTVPVVLPELPGLRVEEILSPGSGSKYDLTIEFRLAEDGLGFSVEWDTSLYLTDTVMRLMAHLRAILMAVSEDPSMRVDEVPMLSAEEVLEMRARAEPEPVALPERCLHELFAEQAARTPDAIAVRDGPTVMTYAHLDRRSTAIGKGLVAQGVAPDVPVGVMLDRSADLVAALFGILKAGGAYLPIDTETPLSRVGTLLSAARAPVCIVPGEGDRTEIEVDGVRATAAVSGCRTIDVATLARAGAADQRDSNTSLPAVRPTQLCAIYFTSGSTGEPKGVACTHRGWVSQMHNMQLRYQLAPGEVVLLKTPLGFDDVAREVFWPLMVGGQVVVLAPGLHRDPRALIQAAIDHRVVWLQFVPGMLALFLEDIGPEHADALRHLRHVLSDGDRLRPETVKAFHDRLGAGGCRLNNHWGTTEVSIDTTHHPCGLADGNGADPVALGRPMEHNAVYVLDHALQPVPQGAIGELCIGGAGLARGYLGQPGQTARAFVPHPWLPGERLYRTGDTGRVRADGSLQYCGRRDHQVKVRGVRIELGEIEATVRAFPGVTDAVAATWEPEPGDRRLVAYATIAEGEGLSAEAAAPLRARLRDFLTDRLAPSAVPSAIMLLPQLPRVQSGKIDRRSLPRPDLDSLHDEVFAAPATDTERALASIWSEVLGVARLGANDDFFAAGGHSLLVTRVLNRIRSAFGVDAPIRLVFEHPTVRSAALQLEELILAEVEAMSDAEAERLVADEARQSQEPVEAVHG